MKKHLLFAITIALLISTVALPAHATTDMAEQQPPPLAACQPQEWQTLSQVLSAQTAQEHILGMPEPFILAEFGAGGGLQHHHDEGNACTPGASCSPGQPWCRAQHICNQWREAYIDWSCIVGYASTCEYVWSWIPASKLVKVWTGLKWIWKTVTYMKKVKRRVCTPTAIFGCARPKQCVGGWRTEYKQQC